MRKPENWYGFKVVCELYYFGQSNMSPPSKQQYCRRKDRQDKDRPRWEGDVYFGKLRCNWNVCPKIKLVLRRKKY